MGRHVAYPTERLFRNQRLRRRDDFDRCYRQGQRRHGSLISVHSHPNDRPDARLGVTASRRVGNAVVRHRLKRQIREIFRRSRSRESLTSVDIVVHLKPTAARTEFADLRAEVERLLEWLEPDCELNDR